MFTIIKNLPDDILGVLVAGKTTAEDYDRLNPIMEQYKKTHESIKMLLEVIELDYTAKALWEELKIDFKYMGDINSLAVVSDKKWLEQSVEAFGSIVPGVKAKGFEKKEIDKAIDWLKANN